MFITRIYNSLINEHFRRKFRSCGKDLRFHPKDSLFEYRNISIGERGFINRGAYFSAPNGQIVIGDDALIGADVFLAAGHHRYSTVGKPINGQGYLEEEQRIVIGDDVWLASRVIVLGNVTIHNGAVVGAGSMVLKDLPPYCLCAGNPRCIPIRYRYTDEELREHLRIMGNSAEETEHTIRLRRQMTEGFDIK
jgi:acetyltransferase-like isoleucine patch superfamily enzyme